MGRGNGNRTRPEPSWITFDREIGMSSILYIPPNASINSRRSKIQEGQRFNALQIFADQPDELGLWPKGVVPRLAGGGGSQSVF